MCIEHIHLYLLLDFYYSSFHNLVIHDTELYCSYTTIVKQYGETMTDKLAVDCSRYNNSNPHTIILPTRSATYRLHEHYEHNCI